MQGRSWDCGRNSTFDSTSKTAARRGGHLHAKRKGCLPCGRQPKANERWHHRRRTSRVALLSPLEIPWDAHTPTTRGRGRDHTDARGAAGSSGCNRADDPGNRSCCMGSNMTGCSNMAHHSQPKRRPEKHERTGDTGEKKGEHGVSDSSGAGAEHRTTTSWRTAAAAAPV